MFTGSEFPTSGANSPGPAQDSQASDRQGRSPGQRAAFSHPDRIDNTRPSGKVFVRIVTWITGRCAVRFLSCRHVPDSGGEDVSSLGSSSAEYFGGMAQECVRWLSGRIGPGLAANPGSVTVRAIPARGAPCGRSPFETPFEIVAPD